VQVIACAFSRALLKAGSNIEAKMAIIAITTVTYLYFIIIALYYLLFSSDFSKQESASDASNYLRSPIQRQGGEQSFHWAANFQLRRIVQGEELANKEYIFGSQHFGAHISIRE
jgi:hypothetical protein